MIKQELLRVVPNSESETACFLSWSDAPYVLEVLVADGWHAIWGLGENMSVSDALDSIDDAVLDDLIAAYPEMKA
jgi:hypothetical protein